MSSTIFLSFLGTSKYLECIYQFDEKVQFKTKYTQIAIIRKHISEINEYLFFVTGDARTRNWEGEEKLRWELEKLGIKHNTIKKIDIPNGFDSDELLAIFHGLVSNIPENSKLIIDVTHSFRSLPLMLGSVLEYLKKVKNTEVIRIYYGAFEVLGNPQEVQKISVDRRIARMLDLTYLSAIQDWTSSIEHFLKFGNTSQLKHLSKRAINPILSKTQGKDEVAKEIRFIVETIDKLLSAVYTCRSKLIFEYLEKIKGLVQSIDTIIKDNYLLPQLNEPFLKIKSKLENVKTDNSFFSIIMLVGWCIDFNWIQQGYTLLQENVCSYIIDNFGKDYNNLEERQSLSSALKIIEENIAEDRWRGNRELIRFYVDRKDKIISIAKIYNELSEYRNDLNHAGYRSNVKKESDIREKLSSFFQKVKDEITLKVKNG